MTEAIFQVKCKGRDSQRRDVLDEAVDVEVRLHQNPDSDTISSVVRCIFNTGGHGQRCIAYNPVTDKIGEGVICAYAWDIPYALDEYEKLLRGIDEE